MIITISTEALRATLDYLGGIQSTVATNIATEVWGKEMGEVYCRKCGRVERVNYARCLTHGWPKCCGETMTVDAPKEKGIAA